MHHHRQSFSRFINDADPKIILIIMLGTKRPAQRNGRDGRQLMMYQGDRVGLNDLPDDLHIKIISYAADGNIASRLCDFQTLYRKWDTIIREDSVWEKACAQKFSGIFQGACTRQDFINLNFGYNYQAWAIQRAVGRYAFANGPMGRFPRSALTCML